jgi:hypothetical protein
MKQALSLLLIASAIALPTASAFAASGQPASPDITRQQVRADLYRSFLTGTTANDEKYTYPSPPANRADIEAFRCHDARAHLSRSDFPSIVKSVCTG